MTSFKLTSLPPELIYLVLSAIASEKDHKSLRNISLTCPALRGPSQRLLLSHIRVAISSSLNPGLPPPSGDRLLELLSSGSKIVSYVKRITMFDPEPLWAGWMGHDDQLVRALDQFNLTQIECFTLICSDHGTYGRLDECLRATIVRICESPSLLTFSLSGAPLQLIWACGPSLKHFQARHSFKWEGSGAGIPSFRESQVVQLDSFQLGSHSNPVSTLQFILRHPHAIRVDQIRTLHLTVAAGGDDEDVLMGSLVKACRNSLKTLKLVPHVYPLNRAQSVFRRFPHCPNLTNLDIKVDTSGSSTDCLRGTASFLESLPPSNAIQVLHLGLEFNYDARHHLTGGWGDMWSAALRRIGNCVTTGFPRLGTVTVEIPSSIGPRAMRGDVKDIRTWVVEALAIPPERNLLHVA
ncbi:hypothetical protein FA13DRAFT_1734264 [Coprinellus micaceus]|uniref:F-box domain-containing protein n=1 Tax=Coprinellus micaceus TaxID=71717 RepID=A0A4Y7T7H8_COPMI|nr:hypothetical protein FA13DRAFT_1734264 [Coprinellus micaceus]